MFFFYKEDEDNRSFSSLTIGDWFIGVNRMHRISVVVFHFSLLFLYNLWLMPQTLNRWDIFFQHVHASLFRHYYTFCFHCWPFFYNPVITLLNIKHGIIILVIRKLKRITEKKNTWAGQTKLDLQRKRWSATSGSCLKKNEVFFHTLIWFDGPVKPLENCEWS